MSPRAFTAGWLVSAALLSSWAVSSAADQAAPPRAAATAAGTAGLPPVSIDLDSEIGRLAARTHAAALARTPARNPFAFADRRAAERRPSEPRPAEPRPAELPNAVIPAPVPSLAGIADTGAGGLTAVVSLREMLHYVKTGDVIDGRYRVDSVSFEGVDVFDLTLGTVLRLSLQW
ncbi:MAG TPA: hypothetical protein VMN81_01335 [Vicinamibacterales bacterium]|nr:hypothetical protein [Vicinamibacterales bacterium]